MDYKKYDGSLYDYTAGILCGVLVKENVMRKLAKLQAKHLEDVKRLLVNGAENGDVFPSMWTLHYPKGEQTVVKYIDKSTDVRERIRNATHSAQPEHYDTVFIASSMEEAKNMAEEHFKSTEI